MRPPAASATRPRRSSSSGHSFSPATAVTRSGSKVSPTTVAAVTAARASSDRPAARSSTASRTLSGSGTSAPSSSSTPDGPGWSRPLDASADASSFTKKGTPSVRSNTARCREGAAVPRARSSRMAVATAPSGSTVTCRRWPARRSSLRVRRIEWPLGSSSLRNAPRISSGWVSTDRASAPSSSRVASSAHCRSSRNRAAGCRAAIAARARRTASNRVARSPSGAAGPSSGRSSARWAASGPSSSRPPPAERRCDRSTSTMGPNAAAPPWTPKPSSTSRPEPARTRRARVVLPTPASPASRTSDPRPARASAAHDRNSAHSRSRPMSWSSRSSFCGRPGIAATGAGRLVKLVG
jgi:hypothetical protein